MSRLADYSKFDHLTEDSDDESQENNNNNNDASDTTKSKTKPPPSSASPATQSDNTKPVGGVIVRDERSGRYRFDYNGNTMYEFEQSLDDVTIYTIPPPHVTKGRQINCVISANHLKLGQVGQNWFLNEGTYGTVDVDESTWTLEDYDGDDAAGNRRKVIVITLVKANRGTVWEAALKGNPNATGANSKTKNATGTTTTTMDAISKEQVKKELMLQRFNEENPGFDFSGADFNGSIPDARDFMGGVKYQ